MKTVSDYNNSLVKLKLNIDKFNLISDTISKFNSFESLNESLFKMNNQFTSNNISYNLSEKLTSLKSFSDITRINNVYNTFNNFAIKLESMSTKINRNIYFDYINNYQRIINNYSKKQMLNNNHIEYLNIVGDIFNNKVETLSCLNDIPNVNDENLIIEKDLKLKHPESLMPIYYGYVYRQDSNKTFYDVYSSSDFKVISECGKNILKRIKNINIVYRNKNNEDLFKYNSETFDLATHIADIPQNEIGFENLINLLYKGIFESSQKGRDNRILNMGTPHSSIMMIIKYFRNFYDHELSNGPKKTEEVINYNKEKIGMNLPDKPKDWLKLQACLYKDIELMLDGVFEYLNNQ